jgi:SecD/SecF fusion protein
MRIRYQFFAATAILTVLGATVFFARGKDALNIDFTGGTAYTGQLKAPMDIGQLRAKLEDQTKLKVADVRMTDSNPVDGKGMSFEITFEGDTRPTPVRLPNPATVEEVRARAQQLPDVTVEQIFAGGQGSSGSTAYFTVRTSEKAVQLVEEAVTRLLGDDLKKIELKEGPADNPFNIQPETRSALLEFVSDEGGEKKQAFASPSLVSSLLEQELGNRQFTITGMGNERQGHFSQIRVTLTDPNRLVREVSGAKLDAIETVAGGLLAEAPRTSLEAALRQVKVELEKRPQPERLENFDSQLAEETQSRAVAAIVASWAAILLYLWFRFGNWTFGAATVLCLIHDLFFTLGVIALCHYVHLYLPWLAQVLLIRDFKIDLPAVAALLTLVGYSVSDTIVVFDRIREVRGKNPELTPKTINDSVNQTLSRTLLTACTVALVVFVLYLFGGEGVHLFAFVMVVGVVVGTYSSIYIASPLLLMFGEGSKAGAPREQPAPEPIASSGSTAIREGREGR